MEFSGLGEKTAELKELITKHIGKLWDKGLDVYKTGKSAVLRARVAEVNFKDSFSNECDNVKRALENVAMLYSILDDISEAEVAQLHNV